MTGARPPAAPAAGAGPRGARAVAHPVHDLGAHRAAWDEAVARSALPSPFLRSWWLDAMAVDDPTYVLVLDGDDLVGGVALEERRHLGVSWFRHIGDTSGDHLDVVARRGHEEAVIGALEAWWSGTGNRVLRVADGAAANGGLGARFPRRARTGTGSVAPYAVLASTFDEYLRSRPGQVRSTIKRATKRLEREGVEHRVVDDPADVDRALESLRILHDARWASRSGFLPDFPRFATAARAGVAAGDVVFHELVHEGTVIASEVDFELAGRTSFYQSGRLDDHRWRGSGSVLKAKVVERACRLGHREYDLLRGAEPYKDLWSTGTRQLVEVRAAHGPGAQVAQRVDEGARWARTTGRRVLRRVPAARSPAPPSVRAADEDPPS